MNNATLGAWEGRLVEVRSLVNEAETYGHPYLFIAVRLKLRDLIDDMHEEQLTQQVNEVTSDVETLFEGEPIRKLNE
jgi:hypothetical protein